MKKIILIIISLIILLAIGLGVGYSYYSKNLLEQNKELFLKYFSQLEDQNNGFIDSKLIKFDDYKQEKVFINKGKVTINAQYSSNETEEQLNEIVEYANDISINFNGKNDLKNDKVEQNIEIDYGNNVIFPINYIRNGEMIGLQTKYVGSRYIATKNDKIVDILQQAGINTFNDLTFENFSKDKLTELDNESTQIFENLPNERFTELQTMEGINYTVLLKTEEINQIEKILGQEITEMDQIKLTIVQQNDILKQIIVQIGMNNLRITKQVGNNKLSYLIELNLFDEQTQETTKLSLESKINDLDNLPNEEYLLKIEKENNDKFLQYNYKINNDIEFMDNIDIVEINDETALILDNQNEQTVQTLIKTIRDRLEQVNREQMQEIGIQSGINPLFYSFNNN